MIWLYFFLAAGVIVAAGVQLARYGDVIAEKTGMGRSWIGLVLLAATTSLPELFTGIGATAVYELPDIAVGDVMGSCMFNLLIISLMDVVGGRVPLSARAQPGHALSIGFGLMLVGVAGMGLAGADVSPSVGWIGLYTPVLIVLYFVGMRVLFRFERRRLESQVEQVAEEFEYADISARHAAVRYGVSALVVIVAAVFLPRLAEGIAEETGLGQAFVGTLFVGITTSLPEIVVSLAAVRIGAIDLAVGNVLGSNLFNLFILGLDDIFFVRGPILAAADASQRVAVLAIVMMYGLLLAGLTYQSLKKRLILAWDTAGILLAYALGVWLMYVVSTAG